MSKQLLECWFCGKSFKQNKTNSDNLCSSCIDRRKRNGLYILDNGYIVNFINSELTEIDGQNIISGNIDSNFLNYCYTLIQKGKLNKIRKGKK